MLIQIPSWILVVPFILQGVCMAVDEFLFHWRRMLPRWERIGHPLDTLTVFVCYGWLALEAPAPWTLAVYAALSTFSSLFVTKDEAVHLKHCGPQEQWLHAVLFVLHPVVLLSAALLWPAWHGETTGFVHYQGFEPVILQGALLLTFSFGLYQLIYWNFISGFRNV